MKRSKKHIIMVIISVILILGIAILIKFLTSSSYTTYDVGYIMHINGDEATVYSGLNGKFSNDEYPSIDSSEDGYTLSLDEYKMFKELFDGAMARKWFGDIEYKYDIIIECEENFIAINSSKELAYCVYMTDDGIQIYEDELLDGQKEFVDGF